MDTNKFRSPGGNRYTLGLFLETADNPETVIYTLKDRDWKGFPSLYLLYMACQDPLEYTFAKTYLESHEHWQMIATAAWFEPYITRWREELDLSIRTDALLRLAEDAKSKSKSAAQSNKFLLERGWDLSKKRGRPSKEEIKKQARKILDDKSTLDADFDRLAPLGPIGEPTWTKTQ